MTIQPPPSHLHPRTYPGAPPPPLSAPPTLNLAHAPIQSTLNLNFLNQSNFLPAKSRKYIHHTSRNIKSHSKHRSNSHKPSPPHHNNNNQYISEEHLIGTHPTPINHPGKSKKHRHTSLSHPPPSLLLSHTRPWPTITRRPPPDPNFNLIPLQRISPLSREQKQIT